MTTPLRIVYDCSSREAKHLASLNDCLETGPPFLQQLPAILLHFRTHKFGISADIEKAFLHVQVHHKDCDFSGHAVQVILRANFKHIDSELSYLAQPVLRLCCTLPSTAI